MNVFQLRSSQHSTSYKLVRKPSTKDPSCLLLFCFNPSLQKPQTCHVECVLSTFLTQSPWAQGSVCCLTLVMWCGLACCLQGTAQAGRPTGARVQALLHVQLRERHFMYPSLFTCLRQMTGRRSQINEHSFSTWHGPGFSNTPLITADTAHSHSVIPTARNLEGFVLFSSHCCS